MWRQSYFWFIQPSSELLNYDYYFLWFFLALTIVGLVLKLTLRFMAHEVYRKLWNKIANLGLTMGFSGLVWAGLRYENTPIFADRYWAGLVAVLALIWLIFIVKYLVTSFRVEKREFDKQVLNSKYIPSRK